MLHLYFLTLLTFSAAMNYDLADRRCAISFVVPRRPRANFLPIGRGDNIVTDPRGQRQGRIDPPPGYDGNIYVGLARHHIIPYNVLRDFFGMAIARARNRHEPVDEGGVFQFGRYLLDLARHRLRIIKESIDLLTVNMIDRSGLFAELPGSDSLDDVDVDVPDVEPEVPHIITVANNAVEFASNLAYQHFNRIHNNWNSPEVNLLQELFAWIPGNIVIGPIPASRGDDPSNGVDDGALAIVSEVNSGQARLLRELYRYITAYMENELIDGTRPTLNHIVDLLDQVNILNRYEYNPNYWTAVREGREGLKFVVKRQNRRNEDRDLRKRRYISNNQCPSELDFKYDLVDILRNYVFIKYPNIVA